MSKLVCTTVESDTFVGISTLEANYLKHEDSSLNNIELRDDGALSTHDILIERTTNSNTAVSIEVGTNPTGSYHSFIDFTGDTTYTDYGLRLIRYNTGANAGSQLVHRGTGSFSVNLQDGGSASYPTSSDYRLKENVVSITDGITKLKTLKPYRFNYKHTPSETIDGFLAHEATAVPCAVKGEKDGVLLEDSPLKGAGKKGDPVYQSIDYSKYVPLLTAALQEALTKIETLEAKVTSLESI